jgi:lipopolysaccharide transport system ATP-binding protein
MSSIIEVKNLSKSYTISHEGQEKYTTLRDVMAKKAKKLFSFPKALKTESKITKEEFWALKDIDFEIAKGDRVGIIGRNGAGKSTLLKILSRIVEPTSGSIKIKGRVASLLEVGTGFHPELTGRENIFLNGAILGMSRAEIRKHFDAIVDFAEIEKFLDTPVKRYSSGMYVRLSFAVAAHLEPEILIVDEVLAVGDAQFQKKCLGKMEDVSKNEGRTVLFVSHQMGTISQLCSKSIFLEKGNIIKYDSTPDVIDYYIQNSTNQIEKIERNNDFTGNHFRTIKMTDKNHLLKVDYSFEEEVSVMVKLILPEYNSELELAMRLIDKHKNAVFTIHEKIDNYISGNKSVDLLISIPPKFLTPGRYSWVMCINHPGLRLYDLQNDVLPFNIIDTGSDFSRYEGLDYGSVFANYSINKI